MPNGNLSVSGDDLGAYVNSTCHKFAEKEKDDVFEATKAAGLVAKHEVIAHSPKRTGKYAAGWRMRTKRKDDDSTSIVYNATNPSISHLLENGHGGPHPAKAIPHIEPAYEAGKTELMTRLELS